MIVINCFTTIDVFELSTRLDVRSPQAMVYAYLFNLMNGLIVRGSDRGLHVTRHRQLN